MMQIDSVGLVCPVGHTAAAACAALRAGLDAFSELPFWDANAMPVIGAMMADLDLDLHDRQRLLDMLAMAIEDCLSGVPALRSEEVPLLIGLAEPERPGAAIWSGESLLPELEQRLCRRFHPDLSMAIAKGHTSGTKGLRRAQDYLQNLAVPACIVCAVDSYINASSIFWLDQSWRLKREGHTDGVMPGEAAAAALVRRRSAEDDPAGVHILGLGFGLEPASILTSEPLLAVGLADACRRALAQAGWEFHHLDFRISDVTGESYGFRELALVEGRLARVVRAEPQPLWHPADAIGDTGAAAGLVQLVMATAAWRKGYAPGARAACFTSAVKGDRAVALLQSANA